MPTGSIPRFAVLFVAVALALAACGQPDEDALSGQTVVVPPALELSKSLTVHRSQSVRPVVTAKTADETEVDVTSGSAELSYTIVVENVVVAESDSATVADVTIENTGSSSVTVDIVDTLLCGDGSGAADPGGPLAEIVVQQSGVTIPVGGSHVIAGPFGPYDVGACPDLGGGPVKDVVDRLVVSDAASGAVIAEVDLLPTDATAISTIAAGFLVDVETLPTGYGVAGASLTLGGADVPFSGSADGDTYTIVTDGTVDPGSYRLTKTIVRDDGVACEPDLQVLNTAYVSGDGGADDIYGEVAEAIVALRCTPDEPGGGEGCTPGFWKNWTGAPPGSQPNAWLATGYDWSDPFTSAGFVDAFRGKTLLEVLDKGGGGKNALGRHAVAALLNAAHPDVSYDLTATEVVAMFNDAVENGGDLNALKNLFMGYNEQGCPLSQAVY